MIKEGLELMVVGMGVVSSFLVLLVLLMKTSGYLFNRTPEKINEGASLPSGQKATPPSTKITKAIAIAAAYQHQRKTSNQ